VRHRWRRPPERALDEPALAERADGADRFVVAVVVQQLGSEREEFGGDPCADAVQGAGVVAFKAETVSERPEDALDALADRRDVWSVA
jgi:hypothetical protein